MSFYSFRCVCFLCILCSIHFPLIWKLFLSIHFLFELFLPFASLYSPPFPFLPFPPLFASLSFPFTCKLSPSFPSLLLFTLPFPPLIYIHLALPFSLFSLLPVPCKLSFSSFLLYFPHLPSLYFFYFPYAFSIPVLFFIPFS